VIEVSSAEPDDIPEIACLAAISLPQPWPARVFEQELRLTEARLCVAKQGARRIGFLAARRVADEVHILSLAVDPSQRRRGVARALLDALLRDESASGARSALLEVRASNVAARAFYANSGFVAVGRRPRYYANGEDALLMTRSAELARREWRKPASGGEPKRNGLPR
jgi:ribosomal-protein-alanine N-acetyltransferase